MSADPIVNTFGKLAKSFKELIAAIFDTGEATATQQKHKKSVDVALNILARLTLVCLMGLLITWAVRWTSDELRGLDDKGFELASRNLSVGGIVLLTLEVIVMVFVAMKLLVWLLNWIRATECLKLLIVIEIANLLWLQPMNAKGERLSLIVRIVEKATGAQIGELIGTNQEANKTVTLTSEKRPNGSASPGFPVAVDTTSVNPMRIRWEAAIRAQDHH